MADIYTDFVFGKLDGDLDAVATTVTVDDVSQFPSTHLLSGDVHLTISSTLVYPPTFEIVRLTGVDPTAKTLTVVRGQDGTQAHAHTSGTYVKGALTSPMLRRIRSGEVTDRPATLPSQVVNDRLFNPSNDRSYRRSARNTSFTTGNLIEPAGFYPVQTVAYNRDTSTTKPLSQTMDWLVPAGSFTNGSSSGVAYGSSLTDGKAIALLDMGSVNFSVSMRVLISTDTTTDCGVVIAASDDGLDGYYFSLKIGELPTLLAPDGSTVGTVGTAVITANSTPFVSVIMHKGVLRVWWDPFGYEDADYFETPAQGGTYCGFRTSNGAGASSGFGFSDVQSRYVIGETVATNCGMGQYVTIAHPSDDPTQVHFGRKPFLVDPVNAIGTFGTVTPPNTDNELQSASYQSGAVDDTALLLWGVNGETFDQRVAISVPSDTDADFGLWLRGTADGQTGLYLQFVWDYTEWSALLYSYTNGGIDQLGFSGYITQINSFPTVSDADSSFVQNLVVRVTMQGDDLLIYSGTAGNGPNNTDTLLVAIHFDDRTAPHAHAGECFGFMLRNQIALNDATLGVRAISFPDMGLRGGIVGDDSSRYGFGPPSAPASPSDTYIDLLTNEPWISLGSNDFVSYNPSLPWLKLLHEKPPVPLYQAPLGNYWSNGGLTPCSQRREGDRICLRGSVVHLNTGPDAQSDEILLSTELEEDGLSSYDGGYYWFSCVHIDATTGTPTLRPVCLNGNVLTSPQYQAGELLYLDNVSWPAK